MAGKTETVSFTAMTEEAQKQLRAPFDEKQIGKLPRVTCPDCSNRKCNRHNKAKCPVCSAYISTQHMHLNFVGHANITDRLLQVDPFWQWEPMALDEDGLPRFSHGGLWIRLTVCGVTRLGFGDAGGKSGPDAVKETIGDALRNAAMRFGVGVDLWGANPVHWDFEDEVKTDAQPVPAPAPRNKAQIVAELDRVEKATQPAAVRLSRVTHLIEEAKAAGVLDEPVSNNDPTTVREYIDTLWRLLMSMQKPTEDNE